MVESFALSPAPARALWFLIPVVLILVAILGLLVATGVQARRGTLELSEDEVRVAGFIRTRRIPLRSLQLERARIIDLGNEEALTPRWRTFGTALPGYRSGWFRLRNGEKALLHVTDPTQVVYVPTSEDFSLLLSLRDPEAFLAALTRRAPTIPVPSPGR